MNHNLPKEIQPRCVWSLCDKEDECKKIEVTGMNYHNIIRGTFYLLDSFSKTRKNPKRKSYT